MNKVTSSPFLQTGWLKRKHQESLDLFSPPKKRHCPVMIGSTVHLDSFLKGLSFCLSNQIISDHKELRSIIESAGGTVVSFITKVSIFNMFRIFKQFIQIEILFFKGNLLYYKSKRNIKWFLQT